MNIGINRRLAVTAMAGGSCGLLFGYDIGAISGATQGLRAQFALSPSALGLAVAVSLLGTIAGSVAAGFAADAFNRRRTLLVSAVVYLFASVASAFALTFEQFAICRFACGIAIGLISVAAPMYLAEISPAHLRGRLVGSFQIDVGIGVVVAFVLSYLISLRFPLVVGWRWSMGYGAIPALLCQLLLLPAAPSPRWLALKHRFVESRSALAALGSTDPDTDQTRLVASLNDSGASPQSALFSRRHVRPILLAASIAVFNQLSGVNVLLYYILDVFAELGSGHLNARKDAMIVAAMSIVVTTIAVSVIDNIGRKPLLLVGAVGMGACLALLPAIRYLHWSPTSVVLVLVCYNAFFAFSQGTVIWVYLSEIFPLPVRARGQSLGCTVHWVANALITGSFPVVASRFGAKVFVVLAGMMAVQFFVILFRYPETKRIGLETLASDISPVICNPE